MSEEYFDPTEQNQTTEPTPDMEDFYHQRFAEWDEQDAIREQEKPVESRDEHGNLIFTFPVASTRRLDRPRQRRKFELDEEEDALEAMLEANSNRSQKVRFKPSRLPVEPPRPEKPDTDLPLTAPVEEERVKEDEREKEDVLEDVLQDVLSGSWEQQPRERLSYDLPGSLPEDVPAAWEAPPPERPFPVARGYGLTPSEKLERQEKEEQLHAELRQSARKGEEMILNIPLRRRADTARIPVLIHAGQAEETAPEQAEEPAAEQPDGAQTPAAEQDTETPAQPSAEAEQPDGGSVDESDEDLVDEEPDEEGEEEPRRPGLIARLFGAWFEERIEEQGRQINADVEYEQEHQREEQERAARRPFRFPKLPKWRKKAKPVPEQAPEAQEEPAAGEQTPPESAPAPQPQPAAEQPAPLPVQPPRRLRQSAVEILLEPGLEEDAEPEQPEPPEASQPEPEGKAEPGQQSPDTQEQAAPPAQEQTAPAQQEPDVRTPEPEQPAEAAKQKPGALKQKKKSKKKAAAKPVRGKSAPKAVPVVGEPVVLKKPAAEELPENVIRMPEKHRGKLEKKLDDIKEQAGEFADGMFVGESAETKAEEAVHKKVATLIPATDEERKPHRRELAREKRRKKEEEREARQHRAPDTSPKELYHIYGGSCRSLRGRLTFQFLAAVVLLALSAVAGGELGLIQVPALQENPRLSALLLTVGLAVACVVGLDTLLEGVFRLIQRRPALCTLSSLGTLLALTDGVWYCLIGRDGPLPFCGFAALSLWAMAYGSCKKKQGLRDACEDAYTRSEYERLTMDEAKWSARGGYVKHPGSARGFGSQIQEPDGAERVFRYAAPVMMAACTAFGIISAIGQKTPQMLIWDWSVIFVLATPLSATLAYGLPYARQVRRLRRSGVVLAGWDGVESLKGNAGIVLTDRDLFPDGSAQVIGIQNIGDVSLEKLTGCTASMVREADLGITRIFEDQIRIQGGFFRRVDNLDTAEEGGMSGVIRGDTVLIGTSGYLELHGIPIEAGYQVKNAVFCAINGKLQGIFALSYDLPRTVRPAIQTLLQGGISPILATRDFNITPDILRTRFKLPADRLQYPPVDRRFELSASGQNHNRVLGALIFREGIAPFVDAILGGRRLLGVVRLNTLITVAASVVGALLGLYLTWVHAYQSLSLMNTLFFLFMWLVPTILISNGVDQF